MKKSFISTLLCLSLIGTIATAQTKKPSTTTKSSTTVKSTAPKTTTTKTTTTTTIPNSTTAPVVVEEKKTTTTTTSSPNQSNSTNMNSNGSSNSTTIQQSTGPSKGNKKTADPKPDKVATPKPERVREPKPERVREPRPERVREPRPEKVRSASNSSDGGVKFGIRAEVTQAVTLESGGSYDLSPGVNAGLIVSLPISPMTSIQPEVLYSMQVGKIAPNANNSATISTGSILVPLMVNFNFGQGPAKFMLNLGGYGNYLMSAKVKVVQNGTTTQDGSLDLTGQDKFDYGAALGIGVKINGNLMIEARSFYGLKDNQGKNGFGTIGIGYFF